MRSFLCSVACGFAHSMVVIDRTNVEDRLEQVMLWLQGSVACELEYDFFSLYVQVFG